MAQHTAHLGVVLACTLMLLGQAAAQPLCNPDIVPGLVSNIRLVGSAAGLFSNSALTIAWDYDPQGANPRGCTDAWLVTTYSDSKDGPTELSTVHVLPASPISGGQFTYAGLPGTSYHFAVTPINTVGRGPTAVTSTFVAAGAASALPRSLGKRP